HLLALVLVAHRADEHRDAARARITHRAVGLVDAQRLVAQVHQPVHAHHSVATNHSLHARHSLFAHHEQPYVCPWQAGTFEVWLRTPTRIVRITATTRIIRTRSRARRWRTCSSRSPPAR